jgi:predicted transposase YbfD/YdcC
VQLLAVMDHADAAVLAQSEVDTSSNEISQFQPLLAGLDLAGVVVTADAMHTQRDHAGFLVDRGADYLLVVRANQPALHAQLAGLPWRQIPVLDRTLDHAHGRVEIRTLKVATVAALWFPHAAQAIQVTRRVRQAGSRRWRIVTVYATSLTIHQTSPIDLADYLRGHWGVEALHHMRDVTYAEDASTARRQAPPRAGQPAQPRHRHGCVWPAMPTSPPPCATTVATLPARSSSSAWQPHETDITLHSRSSSPRMRRGAGQQVVVVSRWPGWARRLAGRGTGWGRCPQRLASGAPGATRRPRSRPR